MTKYKLLKDLPWCKAGEIFERKDDKFTLLHAPDLYTSNIKNVDEWFEKVKQLTINDIDWNYIPKKGESYYYVMDNDYAIYNGIAGREIYDADSLDKAMILVGNCFKTEEEAKAYAEWLKAVAELRRSSDFKPDWSDSSKSKFYVVCNAKYKELSVDFSNFWNHEALVYYQTGQGAQNSIKDHKQAWLTYFGVREND